jgi:hypothetical protein
VKIKITDKEREECESFAQAREDSASLYKRRGGFKSEDIVSGAMGEIAVYKALKRAGHDLRKPDFDIYSEENKSYDADLRIKKKHFHVKSQTMESAKRYGKSWLCQRYDPLFKGSGYNHYLVPTVVDLEKNEVEVLGFFPMHSVMQRGCIGECKVPSFRRTKVAIYYDCLDEHISRRARWRMVK